MVYVEGTSPGNKALKNVMLEELSLYLSSLLEPRPSPLEKLTQLCLRHLCLPGVGKCNEEQLQLGGKQLRKGRLWGKVASEGRSVSQRCYRICQWLFWSPPKASGNKSSLTVAWWGGNGEVIC